MRAGVWHWPEYAIEAACLGIFMVSACAWHDLWIYWTAPPLGMLLAADLYVRLRGRASVLCAKLHHPKHGLCIFACYVREASRRKARATA